MKKTLLLAGLLALVFSGARAQKSVKESDLKGVWKLVIDIDKEEIKRDIEDEDNVLAEIFAKSITSAVFGIIDEIDIRFEFLPDNRLRVETNVFGESDVEYSDWYINRDGELIIGDTDNVKVNNDDDDDYWLKDGNYLVAYDRDESDRGKTKEVYLKRVD